MLLKLRWRWVGLQRRAQRAWFTLHRCFGYRVRFETVYDSGKKRVVWLKEVRPLPYLIIGTVTPRGRVVAQNADFRV